MDASTYSLVISHKVAIQYINYLPGVGTGGIIYPRTQSLESVCGVLYVVIFVEIAHEDGCFHVYYGLVVSDKADATGAPETITIFICIII
jgi:hypothetical protein